MNVREKVLASVKAEGTDFKEETVVVPEWDDVQIVVRELSAGDRRAYWARSRRIEEVVGGNYVVLPNDDPMSDIFLVVLSCYEVDGSGRAFQESDIDEIAQGGQATNDAISRLFKVARRVSNLDKAESADEEAVADAGKESSETPTDTSSSSLPTTSESPT